MGTYRAYCFDGTGKVWVEDKLGAVTDEEAIAKAITIKDAVRLEIRDDGRLVTVVDHKLPKL